MDGESEIDDLIYKPAFGVMMDEEGPVRGRTLFCNVPYTFERRADEDPIANTWGVWFDMTPVDEETGLPMRAIGRFRRADSVAWTSFGSPTLKNGPEIRGQYVEFLQRIASETATLAHWDAFNIVHYSDDVLEQVRIECVRMFFNRDSIHKLSESELGMLKSWIDRFRE